MINLSKLQKVVRKDGKIEAQCPACHASGADATGNHLVVYTNGSYGCVANPGDKAHNKEIFRLVGEIGAPVSPRVTVRCQVIPESKVLMKIGRIGQKNFTPAAARGAGELAAPVAPEVADVGPPRPTGPKVESFPPERPDEGAYSLEAAREFLYRATDCEVAS